MWPGRYWAARYWNARYWAKVGAGDAVARRLLLLGVGH